MMDIPKESITIGLQGKALKLEITTSDGNTYKITDLDTINNILEGFYSVEGVTIEDLIASGKIKITSSKVWSRYALVDGKFIKIAVEEEKNTGGKPSPEPETKPEEEDSKKRIRIKNVSTKSIAWFLALSLVFGGLAALISKNLNKTSNDSAGSKKYRVDINDDGTETTYNMTDEDAVEMAKTGEYDHTELGCIITTQSMEEILKVIDDYTNGKKQNIPISFEELVISDDYDAVKAASDLKIDVVNGTRKAEEALAIVSDYVFLGKTYVNGKFVENYNHLHTFGQYIYDRIGQFFLAKCHGYNEGPFDYDTMDNLFTVYSSDLYAILTESWQK